MESLTLRDKKLQLLLRNRCAESSHAIDEHHRRPLLTLGTSDFNSEFDHASNLVAARVLSELEPRQCSVYDQQQTAAGVDARLIVGSSVALILGVNRLAIVFYYLDVSFLRNLFQRG